MNQLIIALTLFLSPSGLFSQSLPHIFASTPKRLLDSKILAAYPKNTWLENLVVGPNGALYATNYLEGKVFKIAADGEKEVYAAIDGKIAGIAVYHKNQFLVTGWDKQAKPAIFKIDGKSSVSKLLNIDGGMFPNGIVHLESDKYLVADSYAGCIWQYDAASNIVSVWLKDKLLERSSGKSQYPAANGLKMYDGNLYVSNTEKQILVKVPMSGFKARAPSLFIDKVNIDDFAFDGSGNIYAATNVYNGVIKITPDKQITIVADLSSGVAGSTSVVIAKNSVGAWVLYVATNGGMAVPPPTGVEEGKIIELSLKK
jgi:sugar lactone lactonase YvrE